MSSPIDQRIDPPTDQRIDPPSPDRGGRIIGPPSSATVAEVHVSRLVINADQVETKTVPRPAADESSKPHWRSNHQRRHSASELAAIAVIPVAEIPSRPPGHMSRPQDHMSRPHDHMSRPHDHMSRPHDHMSRPHDHMSRPHDHDRRQPCSDQQVRKSQRDCPRTSRDRLQSRCCWMCLIIPILTAIAFMCAGLLTFVVMDYKVKKSCKSSIICSISCYNNSYSSFMDCGVVYAGGGLSLLISAMFVLSLTIRICCGVKV